MAQRFGPFEIERRLGVGGMAETFVAVRRGEKGFQQRVCLKRVLPTFSEDPEFVRQFENEARLAASLVHPHIVQLYDFGIEQGVHWMSMELVEGSDLRGVLRALRELGQPVPVDVVLLLAADLAGALAYAHARRIDGRPAGIVHRDVSPSNVLVSYDGAFKLADFGIAKATSATTAATASGVVKGKVPYMAPEQAVGGSVDSRADLFALGVVLYEALSGARPFDGTHDLETMHNILGSNYVPIASRAPHAPAALAAAVTKLLSSRREDRFATGNDVLDALASTPPPTNARRLLGELLTRIKPPEHEIGFEQTQPSPGRGVAVRAAEVPTAAPRGRGREQTAIATPLQAAVIAAQVASPADATRTAAPHVDEPATRVLGTSTSAFVASEAPTALLPPRAERARAASSRDSGSTPFVAESSPAPRAARNAAGWVVGVGVFGLLAALGVAAGLWVSGVFPVTEPDAVGTSASRAGAFAEFADAGLGVVDAGAR